MGGGTGMESEGSEEIVFLTEEMKQSMSEKIEENVIAALGGTLDGKYTEVMSGDDFLAALNSVEPSDYYDDDDEDDDDDLDELHYVDGYTTEFIWHLQDETGFIQDHDSWEDLWVNAAEGNNRIDPLMSASDYYLLFGLINDSFVSATLESLHTDEDIIKAGRTLRLPQDVIDARLKEVATERLVSPIHLLDEVKRTANELFVELVEDLDTVFKEYAHLAVGGEVRHHASVKAYELFEYCERRAAWGKWYWIFKEHGPEALVHMSKLFREIEGNSIGGESWAQASDILYKREMGLLGPDEFTNKQLFVDRIFTLEHNNGCFLNKLDWCNRRTFRGKEFKGALFTMKATVLQAHCEDPPDIYVLNGHASEEVQKLLAKYFSLVKSIGLGIVVDYDPDSEEFIDIEEVTNDKPMIDWSDVETSDGDDTSWLYDEVPEQKETGGFAAGIELSGTSEAMKKWAAVVGAHGAALDKPVSLHNLGMSIDMNALGDHISAVPIDIVMINELKIPVQSIMSSKLTAPNAYMDSLDFGYTIDDDTGAFTMDLHHKFWGDTQTYIITAPSKVAMAYGKVKLAYMIVNYSYYKLEKELFLAAKTKEISNVVHK